MFDDGATSLFTIISYLCIGGLFLIPYIIAAKSSILNGMASFLLLSSYIVAFAGFLEFFRLGRFRNKKIFLITTMLVWWIFIPWIIVLMVGYNVQGQVFAAFISPLFGMGYSATLLLSKDTFDPIVLIAPIFIAVFTWILARQEHSLVERRAEALRDG